MTELLRLEITTFPMVTKMFPVISYALLPMTSKADKMPLETEPMTTVQGERKNLVTKLLSCLTQLIIKAPDSPGLL